MKRVLHIEHRPDVAEWVRAVLEAEGVEVSSVESGEAGIQQLCNADFSLVILSIEAPMKPGDRIIEWIAANRPRLVSRILAVADTELRSGVSAVLEALEIPLLFAPFTSGELVLRVNVMLAGRPAVASRRGSIRRRHALAS